MVTFFVPREIALGEARVAATPETVQQLVKAGAAVQVERGAGEDAFLADADYERSGALLVSDVAAAFGQADVVLRVNGPRTSAATGRHELDLLREEGVWVSFLVPSDDLDLVHRLLARRQTLFSMNLVPRITRAQRMDALSSQANIAGYKAVLLAAAQLPKYFPLLMTAAGTVRPAKVVVMGAGVAGLQAIATARRLGAQVWATDVRLAAKEHVESLGARFIDVPGQEDLEDERGYAKPATPEFLERQRQVVGEHVAGADVVITTALVPGRRAPVLVPDALVARMRRGAVIVDLAAEQGGNCEGTVAGETVRRHGVSILGPRNVPGSVPVHASELYARNVAAFALPLLKEGALRLDWNDPIVAQSAVTHAGEVRHEPTAKLLAADDRVTRAAGAGR